MLQISGKDLGALAMPGFCPRCFWISRHAKLPWQIFPGIFSSIDSYSKKVVHGYFDRHGSPPWLTELGDITGYREPPAASKFRISVEEHGLLLTGAPDAIFEKADGTLVIADYKTSRFTPAQDKLMPVYRVQLNAYAFIARKLGWPPISALSLVYTEPITDAESAQSSAVQREDGFAMGFSARLFPLNIDEAMLPPLFARAASIYTESKPPQPRNGCHDCKKLDDIRTLLGQLPTDSE